MADFSGRLRELRTDKQLTQSEFGALFNLYKQTISGYEKGENAPPIETLQKFADFFGVTTDYLLGRDDTAKPSSISISSKTRQTMLTLLQSLLPYSVVEDKQFFADVQKGNFTDDELITLFNSVFKTVDLEKREIIFHELPPDLLAIKEKLKNLPRDQRKALLHSIIDDAL